MPELTSASRFNVTILGSGTCVPSLTRSACSVFMEIGDSKLLFDSGVGTMRRLLEAGVTIFDISHIFYSHFHPDHTAELVPFLFANKYPDGSRRIRPLTLVGGPGFRAFFEKLSAVYGRWIELPPALLNVVEQEAGSGSGRRFDNFNMDCVPVEHNPESIAYRISDENGYSAVYSGDTDFSESLIKLATNADLLICESALPDELKTPGHLTPSLAGEIARRAHVGHLVLTHLYPECDGTDIVGQCRRSWQGKLSVAHDLMRISMGCNAPRKS